MMEALTEWIKQLIILVIIASFLDLLLPSSSMQRYAKLVLGLFIILTLLSPVFWLFGTNSIDEKIRSNLRINASSNGTSSIENILAKGEQLQRKQQEEIIHSLEQQLQNEIRNKIANTYGREADVQVEITVSVENQPEIRKILVYLQGQVHRKDNKDVSLTSSESIKPVVPVQIQVGKEPSSVASAAISHDPFVQELQHEIMDAYGLHEEQIEIYVEKGR